MKILLAVIIVAACTYIGIVLGARYRKREQVFAETAAFLDSCKSRISFRKLPLLSILDETADTFTSPFGEMVREYRDLLREREYVDYSVLEQNVRCQYLKEEERILYVQLFDTLGKSDAKSQLESLDHFAKSFERAHGHALEDKRKFSGMYMKLGVLCGLGLAVLVF